MQRLVAILLIPFLVVGNSFAHAHGSAAHLSPGQGRAHIHVGSTTKHGHSHESHGHSHHSHGHDHGHNHGHANDQNPKRDDSKPAPLEKTVDHESDALYVAAADLMVKTTSRVSIEVDSCAVVESVAYCLSGIFMPSRLAHPLLAMTSGLPLYLLHAALRL